MAKTANQAFNKDGTPRKKRKPRDPNAPKQPRVSIDAMDFVKAVCEVKKEGGNLRTLANKLGVSYASVAVKFKTMMQKGVKLPDIKGGGRSSFDPVALNTAIKQYLFEDGVDAGFKIAE